MSELITTAETSTNLEIVFEGPVVQTGTINAITIPKVYELIERPKQLRLDNV